MSAFKYDPLTEEEALRERFHLLDDGIYRAVVEKATPRISGKNNEMCELVLTVYDHENNHAPHAVFDYLVFTKAMMWKTKHFCDSAHLEKEYIERRFSAEMAIGKNILVQIGRQFGKPIPADKLKAGQSLGMCYPDKNIVEDYVLTMKGATRDNVAPKTELIDDPDIPF